MSFNTKILNSEEVNTIKLNVQNINGLPLPSNILDLFNPDFDPCAEPDECCDDYVPDPCCPDDICERYERIRNKLIGPTGPTGSTGATGATGPTGPTILDSNGNLDMSCNLIQDVSGIFFCDGTYIGQGNSFDISTNQILDITSTENINIDPSNALIVNGNLEVNELTTIKNDLVFVNNGNNIMSFSDFSSNNQNVQLPSIHSQPISLTRISLFYNDNPYTLTGSAGASVIMPFGTVIKNQLNLGISGNIISPSLDISGQYVEIYLNVEINVGNNTAFQLDISGVDCSFFEIIDFKETSKSGIYYLTFGPHIFIPSEWVNCTQFVFKFINNSNNSITIRKTKIFFKSYYL
jgi:hypothetical protein